MASSKAIYIRRACFLKREDNTIVIRYKDEVLENNPRLPKKKVLPVENIAEIKVFANIDFNKNFLELCSQKGIPIHFFNYYGFYIGSYMPRFLQASGAVYINQVRHYIELEKRLFIAKEIFTASLWNIMAVLKYYSSRIKKGERFFLDEINKINQFIDVGREKREINDIRVTEAMARKIYYSTFSDIIRGKDFIGSFLKREKKPPSNPVNALISFANSLLYTTILTLIYQTYLDPRVSYLHEANFRSYSLHLDIADIFKPIIVDRVMFQLINKNQLVEKDFDKRLNYCLLTESGREKVIKVFENKLNDTLKYKPLKRLISYRELIKMELNKLVKHLLGIQEYKGFRYYQ